MKFERNLYINSFAVLVLTHLISQIMHESAHAVTAYFAGANPTLFHNHVISKTEVEPYQSTLIAAAGPLYSLLQAVICFVIVRQKERAAVPHLFWTWMSLWGYIAFFGYLLMTPFFKYGDTGAVAEQLGIPFTGRLLIGGVGMGAFFFISKIGFRPFAYLWTNGNKKTFYDNLILFPLITGVIVNTLLDLPVPTFLSLLAPLCMPWCVMMVYGKLLSSKDLNPKPGPDPGDLNKISRPLLFSLIKVACIHEFLILGLSL